MTFQADSEPYLPEQIWRALLSTVRPECRQLVSEVADRDAALLATMFYRAMSGHPQAGAFLEHGVVHERLHPSMQRWIRGVYGGKLDEVEAIVAQQRHVGEVHARIHLPIHLVARGARHLKNAFFAQLALACPDDQALLRDAQHHVGHVMDLALELMSEAYQRNTQRSARTDEAYRLFSLGQNMSVERERQRSVLLEWGQEVLFALHRTPAPTVLPPLSKSEFGLWFHHKATAMFEGSAEIEVMAGIMERIDETMLPQLCAPSAKPDGRTMSLLMELQAELENLKFQLNHLFERQLEVENGRDTLTRLLNRRFLPSVLSREIKVASERRTQFAVLLIDVDHFKQVNDEHGHEVGDLVLQQAAVLILDSVRNGDFVFRYGGEEMLVMLVEIDQPVALRIAETLRQRFEQAEFMVGQGRTLKVTISVGVAMYDGHPDYQYLINRGDQAMYQAKQTGRNRVCVAP
ncbi:MAG: GGDEF domain-containing protein [Aquabacterium sp.]|jgi:diguanylate cyclase|uniref:GGDEF domain-containing protein n=1 Tax=Aquabacterium sp. TaxID=1872578 RepID=UPI002A368756|nr:GGDEF domain-containing protein [Aquabacterium sp.]MDX9844985.1 GGDEF domain-containing protein [Aquabacterium sp.]